GEMMGILLKPPPGIRDADHPEQFDGPLLRRLLRNRQVLPQRLRELKPDGQDRVERRHRFLEDHADLAAADPTDLLLAERQQIAAGEANAAPDDAAGRTRDEPQDRKCADRLAAA